MRMQRMFKVLVLGGAMLTLGPSGCGPNAKVPVDEKSTAGTQEKQQEEAPPTSENSGAVADAGAKDTGGGACSWPCGC
mgnify:CR=1 FL=1